MNEAIVCLKCLKLLKNVNVMNCYPCNVNVNKCRGYFNTSNSFKSCNTVDDRYSRICIPNKVII